MRTSLQTTPKEGKIKYFMVFQKKEVTGNYTAQSIIEIVKML